MAAITTKNIIGAKKMKNFEETEEVTLLKDVRVKAEGKKTAELYKKGSTVKVSGNDKIQLIGTGAGVIKEVESKK